MSLSMNGGETSAMLIFPGDINLLHLRSIFCPNRFWSGAVLRRLTLLFPLRRPFLSVFHELHGMHPLYVRKMQRPVHSSQHNIHTGRPYMKALLLKEFVVTGITT